MKNQMAFSNNSRQGWKGKSRSEQSEPKPGAQYGRGFRGSVVVPTSCSLSRNSRNFCRPLVEALRSLVRPHIPRFSWIVQTFAG
jgi:hypothetical protein